MGKKKRLRRGITLACLLTLPLIATAQVATAPNNLTSALLEFPALRTVTIHLDTGRPESCGLFSTMQPIENLGNALAQLPEVEQVHSLTGAAKQVNMVFSDNNPAFNNLPRNRYAMVQGITPIPTSSGYLNADCSEQNVVLVLAASALELIERGDKVYTRKVSSSAIAGINNALQQFEAKQTVSWRSSKLEMPAPQLAYVVEAKNGTLLNSDGIQAIRLATDELFFTSGVDRASISSLITPDIRYLDVVDGGFKGGTVVAIDKAEEPTPATLMRRISLSDGAQALIQAHYKSSLAYGRLIPVEQQTGYKLNQRALQEHLIAYTAAINDKLTTAHVDGAIIWPATDDTGCEQSAKGCPAKPSGKPITETTLATLLNKPVASEIASKAMRGQLSRIVNTGTRIVVIGEQGRILWSTDGAKWTQANTPHNQLLNAVQFINANEGWAVGHDACILKTSDGGKNWQLQHFEPALEKPLLDVLFTSASNGIAVGAYGLMLRTEDGGASWRSVPYDSSKDELHLYAITKLNDNNLLVVGEQGLILSSSDQGKTWKKLQPPSDLSLYSVLADGASGAVVGGGDGRLYSSSNVYKSVWKKRDLQTNANIFRLARQSDSQLLALGSNASLLQLGSDYKPRNLAPSVSSLAVPSYADALQWQNNLLVVGTQGLRTIALTATSGAQATK